MYVAIYYITQLIDMHIVFYWNAMVLQIVQYLYDNKVKQARDPAKILYTDVDHK